MKIGFVLLTFFLVGIRYVDADVILESIKAVATEPRNVLLRQSELEKLIKSASPDKILVSLLATLATAKRQQDEDAAIKLILTFDPFPSNFLTKLLVKEENSILRANELWLLNKKAKLEHEISEVLRNSKRLLSDEGEGFRTYGEGKGYAPLGLRVCDAAYNILVQHFSLSNIMSPLEPSITVPDRNESIDKLCAAISLPLHVWTKAEPPSGHAVIFANKNAP